MAKLIELRQRIKRVEGIRTITRTLATVSAAKLSRTRRRAAGLRDYARKIREILYDQQVYGAGAGLSFGAFSSLLKEREPLRKIALLVITADRGMCGGYNLAVCRLALDFWKRSEKAGQKVEFIMTGRKGAAYFKRRNAEVVHKENWRREGVKEDDVERLLNLLLARYQSGSVDEVYAAYTQFYTPIHRTPRVVRMLPVELHLKEERPAERIEKWYYEPSYREMIDELLAIYLRVQLLDVLLESYASEQGARMITMQEATERADKTLWEFRVQYNRLRREAITTELLGALFASRVTEETGATPGRLT